MRKICSFIFLAFSFSAQGQKLAVQSLTPNEKQEGVIRKYIDAEQFGGQILLLKGDGTFQFHINNCIQSFACTGTWKTRNEVIILTSSYQKNTVPIHVICNNDTSDNTDGYRISVVRNMKGVRLGDAAVRVNIDSLECYPDYGKLNNHFWSLDSVKVERVRVTFSNGMGSNWVQVTNGHGCQIHITVQTADSINAYWPMDSVRYEVHKKYLKPL